MKMNKCLYCGKGVKNKYCNVSCQNRHQNPRRKKKLEFIEKEFICENCGNVFIQQVRVNGKGYIKKCCGRRCSNSLSTKYDCDYIKKSNCIKCNSEIFINKRASHKIMCDLCKKEHTSIHRKNKILIKQHKILIEKICPNCNNKFYSNRNKTCSRKCSYEWKYNIKNPNFIGFINKLKNAGLKSAKMRVKRSKNEIYFSELCKQNFKNVRTNENIFNGWDADIIIDDIKVAVLWNGKWHYEKIAKKHSVKQVQNRDKIKINEIIKYGYIPYVIKDVGRNKEKFVIHEFNKLLNYIVDRSNGWFHKPDSRNV